MDLLEILIVIGLLLQVSTIGHLVFLKNKVNQFRVDYLKVNTRPKKWNEIEP